MPIDDEVIELLDLFVPEEKRRTGIGSALTEEACAFAATMGFKKVQLHVAHMNWGARRIYERLGFTIIDEELHMELEIGDDDSDEGASGTL